MFDRDEMPNTSRNWLLAHLPQEEFQRLLPHMRLMPLHRGQILYEQGEEPRRVYFIEVGLVSLVIGSDDGSEVEVTSVGREGMIGAGVVLGSDATMTRAIVQMTGEARWVPAAVLQDLFGVSIPLQHLVLRYLQAVLVMTFQTTLCNRRHTVESRLARWLLTVIDRTGKHRLDLTHEAIAEVLGTRRAAITEACQTFRDAGYIRNERGHITVLDRKGLGERSCECYGIVRERFRHIFSEARAPTRTLEQAPLLASLLARK